MKPTLSDVYDQTFKLWDVSLFQPKRHPVLMVEVVNVNDEYKQTKELKVKCLITCKNIKDYKT